MDLTISIPDDRVDDFHAWYADWTDGKLPATFKPYPIDQKVEAAAAWWDELTSREKEIISLWIEASPRLVGGDTIVDELGLDHQNSIRGILSWTERRGRKVGFDVLWEFTVDRTGPEPLGHYGIRSVAYADLVRRGRDLAESRH